MADADDEQGDQEAQSSDVVAAALPSKTELQRHRWYVLSVVSIATFMTPFDASIVAVALPAIGQDLRLSYSYGLWAQAAYILVTSALLIPAGRIADARGPVRCVLAGVLIFAVGSLVAGLAPIGLVLIAGRCIQGAGGAFMFATSTAIITAAFPVGERGQAIGLNLTVGYVGLMTAPVVGGLIATYLDWRWVFFINVPIAALTLAAGWPILRMEKSEKRAAVVQPDPGRTALSSRAASVDWPGAVLVAAFFTALFIPLTFSPLWGWGSGKTIGLIVAAVVLLFAFLARENWAPDPMLDLDLIRKNRIFAAACGAAFIYSISMFAVITLTALYAQVVQGQPADRAGLILLVQPAVMVLISPFSGRLSDRVGSRSLTCGGAVTGAIGMVLLSFASGSTGGLVLGLGVAGAGMGLFSSPNMSAIMGSVRRSELSLASGFQATMRFGGQGFSIAVLGSIAAWNLGPVDARIIFLGEAGSVTGVTAFAGGYQMAMLVGAGIALVSSVVSWFARPQHVLDQRCSLDSCLDR